MLCLIWLLITPLPWVFYLASVVVRSAATHLQPNLYHHYLTGKTFHLFWIIAPIICFRFCCIQKSKLYRRRRIMNSQIICDINSSSTIVARYSFTLRGILVHEFLAKLWANLKTENASSLFWAREGGTSS